MRLVEIAGLIDHIQDVRAALEQMSGVAGALDLPEGFSRQPRGAKETALD